MPANLTPEYEKAELRFRQATTDPERLTALREMLAAIPKHKGTEKMQADLKRRLSQLRQAEQKSSHSKGPDPFHVPHSGAGQVVLLGPPNTGKSSLLTATTNADAKVADYPFTTTVPQPGMWTVDGVQLELVDTPPLTAEHIPTGLLGTVRNADVVAVVVEAGEAAREQVDLVLHTLAERSLTLKSVARNQLPADEPGVRSGLVVVNKADLAPDDGRRLSGLADPAFAVAGLEVVPVSAKTRAGLDKWFARLWTLLALIRVYAKEPGQAADLQKPFTLAAGATVADLASQIHRDLPDTMKYARLWGHSRFAGQHVHKTEPLQDRDIVEIHE